MISSVRDRERALLVLDLEDQTELKTGAAGAGEEECFQGSEVT